MPTTTKKIADQSAIAETEVRERKPFDLNEVPEEYRGQVEAMIPEPWVATKYVNRTIAGLTDFEWLDLAMDRKHNPVLAGPTGSGKTTLGRAYCSARRIPYTAIECNGAYDHHTVIGRTEGRINADGSRETRFAPGGAYLVIKYGGLVDIAEANFAHPKMLASWHGVLDARQQLMVQATGETVSKHDSCICTANYNEGYIGVSPLNEAFKNRFAMPFEWPYDKTVERDLIEQWSPRLLAMVWGLRKEEKVYSDIGTNRMQEFIEFAVQGTLEGAAMFFINGFPSEERAVVAPIVEANLAQIGKDLSVGWSDTAEVEDEIDDEELDLTIYDGIDPENL